MHINYINEQERQILEAGNIVSIHVDRDGEQPLRPGHRISVKPQVTNVREGIGNAFGVVVISAQEPRDPMQTIEIQKVER